MWYPGNEGTSEPFVKCYFPLGLVLLALLVVVVHGRAFIIGKQMGMHARIAATAAIYQKVRS